MGIESADFLLRGIHWVELGFIGKRLSPAHRWMMDLPVVSLSFFGSRDGPGNMNTGASWGSHTHTHHFKLLKLLVYRIVFLLYVPVVGSNDY